MKLILDTENSHPTTITVKGKEITLLLIESSILIDSSQIAKLFDKKEKTGCGYTMWKHGISAAFLCGVKESFGGSPLYFAMHIFQNETFQALFGVNNQTEKEEKRMTAYFKTVIMRALKRQSTLLRK